MFCSPGKIFWRAASAASNINSQANGNECYGKGRYYDGARITHILFAHETDAATQTTIIIIMNTCVVLGTNTLIMMYKIESLS